MKPTNVLIVEPDIGHRDWLTTALSEVGEFVVVGAGADLIGACRSCSPNSRVDVLVTKLEPGVSTRIEWWAVVHGILPGVKVVGLAQEADDFLLVSALAAGVMSLHPVGVTAHTLRRAARRAAAGEFDVDTAYAERARARLAQPIAEGLHHAKRSWLGASEKTVTSGSASASLTAREEEILNLVAAGMSNREIAGWLHLSEKTVRNQVSRVLAQLGLRSRTQAAIWAAGRGKADPGQS